MIEGFMEKNSLNAFIKKYIFFLIIDNKCQYINTIKTKTA